MRSLEDMKILMIGTTGVRGHSGPDGTRFFGSRKVLFFMDCASGVKGKVGAA